MSNRRSNGTFGKMKQISTLDQLAELKKGEFFSLVYAPIEGRFGFLDLYYEDPNDEDSAGLLLWTDQKHQKHWDLIYTDDFEIPSNVVISELRKDEQFTPTENQIMLVNLTSELAFTKDVERVRSLVNTIRLFSVVFDLEPQALKLTKMALNTRKAVLAL